MNQNVVAAANSKMSCDFANITMPIKDQRETLGMKF